MKIGFTASAFDLGPHAGHAVMLKECQQNCEQLIVGLHVNPNAERTFKNAPLPPLSQRWIILNSVLRKIDKIIPYETEAELLDLITLLWPDIRFIGEDYLDKEFTGKSLQIPVHYCKRRHSISSSDIRKKIKGESA